MEIRKVYFDNAATTPIDEKVVEVMSAALRNNFGNPSSTHYKGRESKSLLELSRKSIAKALNCHPSEIFFTSGGTEADNMALTCAVRDLGCTRIISSTIEHHAVTHTVEFLRERGEATVDYVRLDDKGNVDLAHLAELLYKPGKAIVSLMHANNEIGNLLDLEKVSAMCREAGAIFHSDTVQSMAHYPFNLAELDIDFITCSAHKFHGPKGIGFLYVNKKLKVHPLIHGGAQERNLRGGTENLYGIAGLAKAMEIAMNELDEHRAHIEGLKARMISRLKNSIPGIEFNGESENMQKSLYTVLSASLPPSPISSMLLFNLDIMGICVSGGSACSSGSNKGSHVLEGIHADPERPAVRFSFSKYNTTEEVDYAVEQLAGLVNEAVNA